MFVFKLTQTGHSSNRHDKVGLQNTVSLPLHNCGNQDYTTLHKINLELRLQVAKG